LLFQRLQAWDLHNQGGTTSNQTLAVVGLLKKEVVQTITGFAEGLMNRKGDN
jgi:hypothetical protein